jgi:hypothetical protein
VHSTPFDGRDADAILSRVDLLRAVIQDQRGAALSAEELAAIVACAEAIGELLDGAPERG